MKRTVALTLIALIMIVATAFAAGAPASGIGVKYSGRTRQHLPITLVLDSRGLISGKYLANYYCVHANGSIGQARRQPTTLGRSRFVRPGHIDYRQTTGAGATADQAHVVASVSGAKITGVFNEAYINRYGSLCHSGKVSFSARR
jgi:hypothetical protein